MIYLIIQSQSTFELLLKNERKKKNEKEKGREKEKVRILQGKYWHKIVHQLLTYLINCCQQLTKIIFDS